MHKYKKMDINVEIELNKVDHISGHILDNFKQNK